MTSHVESVALDRYGENALDEQDARSMVLALYEEGVLEPADAAVVRAHLETCAECRALHAAISDVADTLGGTPPPVVDEELLARWSAAAPELSEVAAEPLPVEVAARIDDSLRRVRDDPSDRTSDDDPGRQAAQIHRLVPKSRMTRWTPYLIAAAAAVFLVGGGVAGVNAMFLDDSAGPGMAEAPSDEGFGSPEAALPYHPEVVSSGTDYTEATLADETSAVIAASGIAAEDGGPEPDPVEEAEPPAELGPCVHALSTETDPKYPHLIDLASFEGDPAWVLVYDNPDEGDERYFAQVVADTCGTGDEAEVLAETTVP